MIGRRIGKLCVGLMVAAAALGSQPAAKAATFEVLYDLTANSLDDLGLVSLGPDHALYGWRDHVIYRLAPASGTWSAEAITPVPGNASSGPYVFDSNGALYMVANGGAYKKGAFYRLTPTTPAPWTSKVLFAFTTPQTTGIFPYDELVSDDEGNFYGQAQTNPSSLIYRFSRRSPQASAWKQTILYEFERGSRGISGLTPDGEGGFYGIAQVKNAQGQFEKWLYRLEKRPNDKWSFAKLYRYRPSAHTDALGPELLLGRKGELYGTTPLYVYRLAPSPNGNWTLTVLHKFDPDTEGQGDGGLALHKSGALYGVTYRSGFPRTVFRLSPPAGGAGQWTFDMLKTETTGNGFGPLLITPAGAIFGTGYLSECACNALYRLKP
jgi:hypothetical protein